MFYIDGVDLDRLNGEKFVAIMTRIFGQCSHSRFAEVRLWKSGDVTLTVNN